ncbi:MAG TPA: hypothetical protein VFY45_08870 [Baekduia sp.]|nr:hypothetical protein [Baekduia sp.]
MRTPTIFTSAGAVVAVVMLIACVATASATRLCGSATTPCPSTYISGSLMQGDLKAGTNVTVTTSGGTGLNPTVTCTGPTYALTTINDGGVQGVDVSGYLSSLNLTTCTSAAPAGCTTSGVQGNVPTFGYVTSTGGGNGTLFVAPPVITVTCTVMGAQVVCALGGDGTLKATVTGGTLATVQFASQALTRPGNAHPACPTAGAFSATYKVTTPAPLYITSS